MRCYRQLKLSRSKSLCTICLAVILLHSPGIGVRAENSISTNIAPDGWPEQLDQRRMYFFKHAFIYAESKSDAVVVNERIEAAIKELYKENAHKTDTIIGLALVTDVKEKPLVDLQKIIAALQEVDKKRPSEKSKKDLKSLIEAKEGIEKEGMDMDMVMSIAPVPIEPNLLPELINKFPEDVDKLVDFCIFVPTDRNIKYGFKKIFDAAIKQKKIGLVERVALIPLMPFIEGKVIDSMKKSQQLVVYERLLEKQKHLTKKQREEKVNAYKKKLGLDDDSTSKSDREHVD